jgi:hypothetical protein
VPETVPEARADAAAPAGEFADPDGLAPVPLAAAWLAPAWPDADPLAPGLLPPDGLGAVGPLLAVLLAVLVEVLLAVADPDVAVALAGGRVPDAGDGPNVATDSIAPATRHTASTLATRGMTVPCPRSGAVSFLSRFRRRRARCSRWYARTSRASSRASSGIWMSSGGSSRPDPLPGFTGHLPARIGPFSSKYHPANGLRIPGPPRGPGVD